MKVLPQTLVDDILATVGDHWPGLFIRHYTAKKGATYLMVKSEGQAKPVCRIGRRIHRRYKLKEASPQPAPDIKDFIFLQDPKIPRKYPDPIIDA